MTTEQKFCLNRASAILLEDFPDDKKNCGNCTRLGGVCSRSCADKNIWHGYFLNHSRQLSGIIYCCPHYTGIYEHVNFDFSL